MSFTPQVGDVIRYDFLWKEQHDKGHIDGAKDRPCTVVVASSQREDGSRFVVLAPITHSPPKGREQSIPVPAKVSKHLGLDSDQSWIRTHEVNVLTWPDGRFPYGLTKAKNPDQWKFGELPEALAKQVFADVDRQRRARTLRQVNRDE
jgi:uncharacterized protein YifN (PemK superfamily)